MKTIIILINILLITFCNPLLSQKPPKKELVTPFGFKEHNLVTPNDTIHYYSFQKNPENTVKGLVVYVQGSDPSPQFFYQLKEGKVLPGAWIKSDYKRIPDDHMYIIVEKTGFEGVFEMKDTHIPAKYHRKNSLHHRVSRISAVITFLHQQYSPQKLIVYGHSEGAPVAAKLATLNNHITHLGFWAGNVLPDFFDFALQSRIAFYKGTQTDLESQESVHEAIDYFSKVVAKDTSSSAVDDFGYTNKRWWSYAEPPINYLIQLTIPVYVQVGTQDQSAPIESSYLIPLEFARLGKKNLTYKVCQGCDHGFSETLPNGSKRKHWDTVFDTFLKWTSVK